MRFATFLALAIATAGCSAQYVRKDSVKPSGSLPEGKAFVIAVPKNGFYQTKEYAGSGKMTAMALDASLEPYTKPKLVEACQDLECLRKDLSLIFDYAVVPEILNWEDRMTEWNGKRDYIQIRLTIYDASGTRVARTMINARSKWATFGGDHPQDLLAPAFERYFRTIF